MAEVVPTQQPLGAQDKGQRFAHGMPTPSPEPEENQTATNKSRQGDIHSQVQGSLATPGSSLEPDPARVEVDKARIAAETKLPVDVTSGKESRTQEANQPIPSIEHESGASSDAESNDEEDKKKDPTEEAKQAIDRILYSKKGDLWGILGVEPGSQQEVKTINAFKKLGCMLHPSYVDREDTRNAFNSKLLLYRL